MSSQSQAKNSDIVRLVFIRKIDKDYGPIKFSFYCIIEK